MSTNLHVTAPPQVFAASSTAKIMWAITACLAPAAGWGIYLFGTEAVVVLATTIGAAVVFEAGFAAIAGRRTLGDGSAVLTGLLIGMSMPPAVPLYVPVTAVFFALGVVKWSFGGLGGNWMNPALAGRVFVFFCWNDSMQRWTAPSVLPSVADATSAATPLGTIREGLAAGRVAEGPLALLDQLGYPRTTLDGSVTSWLNERVFSLVNVQIPEGYVDLFLGNSAGSIGETSALLLLLGSIYLVANGIARWEITVSFFGSFAIFTILLGGVAFGFAHGEVVAGGFGSGDVLFHLFSGGILLVMFFMATDTVTAPITSLGMVLYGLGAGALAFLLRAFGAYPEGAALAVLVMNVFVPIIDRRTRRRRR